MKLKLRFIILFLFVLTVNLYADNISSQNENEYVYFDVEQIEIPFQPDYSKDERWALIPKEKSKYDVDVFFVYPTIFSGNGYKLMDVSDEQLVKKAHDLSKFYTGIFENQANIYAPLYRQASIELLILTREQQVEFLMTAFLDIMNSFDYYLNYYNNGKPFILAGFSQGSAMILELMKTKLKDKNLQEKLIASYIIGYSVTEKDLKQCPWLKPAQSDHDTGCIISYNTQIAANGYSPVFYKSSKAINPISWKTDNMPSVKKQYKGAVIYDFEKNKLIKDKPFETAYLEVGSNALVVDVDITKYNGGQDIFKKGILHVYDYMFFYNNLKENVPVRIKNYFKKHKKQVK